MKTLEIHIPISPTAAFFNMVHFFAASLRKNAGLFRYAEIIVSVGEDCEPFDIDLAHPELARYKITWRWVDRAAFRELSYFATGLRRWYEPFKADYVLMADADMLIAGDISSAVAALESERSVCGVIATFPPFMARGDGNTDARRWPELFAAAGLGPPPMDCPYPGYGHFYSADEGIELGPPYYNFGFVLGSRSAMNSIAETFESDYRIALDYMSTDLSAQAALALSIVRNGIEYSCLSPRYNMWSWPLYATSFPEDFKNTIVLHYLHTEIFSKPLDIESPASVGRWIERNSASQEPMTVLIASLLEATLAQVTADRLEAATLPVAQPLLPATSALLRYLVQIDRRRIYSNFGPQCEQLTQRLAQHHGLAPEHCVTGANATLLLAAALMALTPDRPGCCIMPSWTFNASAHAACLAGRSPFFIDVDPETWAIQPEQVEASLHLAGPVSAVMAVAPFGTAIEVTAWDGFTKRTGVPVVIDAAASFASQGVGRTPVIVSLHATKILGAGEGGYLCSADPDLIRAIRARLNFGFPGVRVAETRSLNAKLSEYAAAVGLAALDDWPDAEQAWRSVFAAYQARLGSMQNLKLFGAGDISSTLIAIVEDQAATISALQSAGVDSRLWWNRGCHREPAFSEFSRTDLPTTEWISEHYIGLPVARDMKTAEMERVIHALAGARAPWTQ